MKTNYDILIEVVIYNIENGRKWSLWQFRFSVRAYTRCSRDFRVSSFFLD